MQGLKTHNSAGLPMQSKPAAPTTTVDAIEASKMLEAALQQMDGIISGATATTTVSSVSGQPSATKSSSMLVSQPLPPPQSLISAESVLSTAKTLALTLEQVGVAAPAPDHVTAAIISNWLDMYIPRQDADECLKRLQRDKESLALQYQMLAERNSEQADKIIELEGLLTERTQQLSTKEELLHRQALTRSALETQKLELMSALSELKLHRVALERENVDLKEGERFQNENGNATAGSQHTSRRCSFGSLGNLAQSSGNVAIYAPQTPPASLRHKIMPQFHSLPRTHVSKNNNNNNVNRSNNNNNRSFDNYNTNVKRNVVFASNEKVLIEDNVNTDNGGSGDPSLGSSQINSMPSPNLRERSARGLRHIFGKLRRSNSGNLELPALEQAEAEFKRGGARATAGGRIEWTTQTPPSNSQASRSCIEWSTQEVCSWLVDLGLGYCAENCHKWLQNKTNVCFFTASPLDIEQELGLRLPLHRKKIQLAIDELMGKEQDPLALQAAQLDVSWVLRWLDDIGLPQYKDAFLQAKVDGRMLHRLTMEDLAHLHVSSCLHIASLRCAILCMRELGWQPECLIRRSTSTNTSVAAKRSLTNNDRSEEGDSNSEATEPATPGEDEGALGPDESTALWTAHRVMEWLRVADLSEYAPNLRGAGVHGALMLYEPRFNANLLADLLSIPPSKTLLRRHLATHFKELLGRNVIQGKRSAETAPGYQPLTITAKLKAPKKTQFSIKRRKSTKGAAGDIEWTDYVCPMTATGSLGPADLPPQNSSTSSSTSTTNSNSLQ